MDVGWFWGMLFGLLALGFRVRGWIWSWGLVLVIHKYLVRFS